MYCVKKMTEDLYWVGASERRLNLFENAYPLTNGVSYNSYLLLDEKTVLIDTVDKSVSGLYFENVEHVLSGRKLDYLIVQHMEPDHAATIGELVLRHPEVTVVCNAKTHTMMQNFFTFDIDSRVQLVKEMDTLTTGRHTFAFVMAPMVHWPEVMVSYDTTTKTLYSADAFGTFGALNGNLYADEVNFRTEWLADARRYYTNIVGKYGTQVQALLKKAAGLEIEMICPLHGPVWRKDIAWFLDKYIHWATYTPEDDAVVIAYASVYGGTENAANVLAAKLSDLGVRNVQMYDVSVTHPSYILSECFRASHLVFISTTYNAGMFVTMENLVHDIVHHNLQNRTIALMENGSWAPLAAKTMRKMLEGSKNLTFTDTTVKILSALNDDSKAQIESMANELCKDYLARQDETANKNNLDALFNIGYGLYVVTSSDGSKDNGLIVNTVSQVTNTPNRIAVTINKQNYSHHVIKQTGVMNVCCLDTSAPFSVFQTFGFQSGRTADKFAGIEELRSDNGLRFLPRYINSFMSLKVESYVDLDTHGMFICSVTEARVISDRETMTYTYYQNNVKPKPETEGKHGFVCKVCGWIYEGDTLPDDIVCPLCKHGAADFEPIG